MESDVRSPKRLRLVEDGFEYYDVFLSHRGPDTKTGFVSFLYNGLEAAALRPFLDVKSIDKSQDAWTCIKHTIEMTPIAIVIFSKEFTHSEWCLKELHLMLDTPSIKVLPVFYKVQPWEVRFPEKGQLAAGFEKLKQRHEEFIIEQWREDLRRSSKLNGWEQNIANQRLESDLVKEIVAKVFEMANKPLPLNVGEYVIGVDRVAKEIIHELDDKKTILMLGLWGMGGIGKSTLGRELYNQLHKRFSSTSFIEDVTNKVNRGGVEKIQNYILKDICGNEVKKVKDKSKGKTILEERLCKKRILLVLDDVCDNEKLDYWISRKMLTKGSMCIVTSRNKRIFEELVSFDVNQEVHIHDVQGLSSVDSKQVFASYAFGGCLKVKQGFEKLVVDISNACNGVPLVLKVCGSHLKGEEDKRVWNDVMDRLNCRSIMDENKIFECLRISYDALEEQHQEMFLDISCALEGQLVGLAIHFWESQGWYPSLGVRTLVARALVTVDQQGYLRIHDHLKDMGQKIVEKKRAQDGVCRHLWMPESLSLLSKNGRLPDSLQTLTIFKNYDNPIKDLKVSSMKDLRILISNLDINVTLRFPDQLRWLCCNILSIFVEIDRINVPTELQHNKLVILSLCRSIDQSLPDSFRLLTNLRVLNLSNCTNLITLPDLLGSLGKLRELRLACTKIQSLPECLGVLSNLEVLDLSNCTKLTALPDSLASLRKLRELRLEGTAIQSLPECLGVLSNLEVLDLSNCTKLTALPDSLGSLGKLWMLRLKGTEIESLPECLGVLSNLEVLDLSNCTKLTALPDSLASLGKLRELRLEGTEIESLLECLGVLSNLEVLDLSNCTKLTALPDSLRSLGKLRALRLEGTKIESLPECLGVLSNLEVLILSNCTKLTALPDSLGSLGKLWILKLKGTEIESLPECLGVLSNLEVLDLSNCTKLTALPDSLGSLGKLWMLRLKGTEIESLPEYLGVLSNLEVLDLSNCTKLTALPDSLASLGKLRELRLEGTEIESLLECLGVLSNLEVLDLSNCTKLTALPDSLGSLGKLRALRLEGTKIESLPECLGVLSNLEVLDLSNCTKLTALPDSLGSLGKLWILKLKGTEIESLPECLGVLSNLEVLDLSNCTKLTALPDSLGSLGKLRALRLEGTKIESLPECLGVLSNLKVLKLKACRSVWEC